MKSFKKVAFALLTIFIILLNFNTIAQVPNPPSGGHGQSGNQSGGNAPVGGGLFILLGLGAVYGVKKSGYFKKLIFTK